MERRADLFVVPLQLLDQLRIDVRHRRRLFEFQIVTEYRDLADVVFTGIVLLPVLLETFCRRFGDLAWRNEQTSDLRAAFKKPRRVIDDGETLRGRHSTCVNWRESDERMVERIHRIVNDLARWH